MSQGCGILIVAALSTAIAVPSARALQASPSRAGACDSLVARTLPPPSFHPASLAGPYTLTLVATWGSGRGGRTEGAARLAPTDSSDRGRAPDGALVAPDPSSHLLYPLYGWADVTLADVGAIAWHDAHDRDPVYPGLLVAVFPPQGATAGWGDVVVEVGSGARDSVAQFDMPSTFLYAERVDSTGMWGRWTSGGLSRVAAGYFCLTRAG